MITDLYIDKFKFKVRTEVLIVNSAAKTANFKMRGSGNTHTHPEEGHWIFQGGWGSQNQNF